ncbi:hypothetical protein CL619_01830 [archaeon]|nr:hypothetical protein [archaeon]
MLRALQLLGYERVIWAKRHSERYLLSQEGIDYEFAIVEVPGHSVFFEVEVIVQEDSETLEAKNALHKLCEKLDLHIFSDEEWFVHVEQMDSEANKVVFLNNEEDMDFVNKELGIHLARHRDNS